jgi:uncharacterized membrane protein
VTAPRRGYIDWLRGVGVLIMIEAHAFDAWTAVEERTRPAYGVLMVLAGFGAPIFLFLAGLSLMLATGARQSKGASDAEAAAAAQRRGWQILAFGFLFRLQSWLLSGGAPPSSMLKVDILNIMGLAMAATAIVWMAGRRRGGRVGLMFASAIAIAMVTPLVRASPLLTGLPDPIESYMRPLYGRGTFALFPWAGFVFAGAGVGLLLDATRTAVDERRANLWLAAAGPVLAATAYGASFLPPIYATTNFWTTSPTFFFLRLGILVAFIPLAYAWQSAFAKATADKRPGRSVPATRWSPLQAFGRASLFVYWIHVELAYGAASGALHKRLSLYEMLAAYLIFVALMLVFVRLKQEFSKPLMTRRLLSPNWGPQGAKSRKQAKTSQKSVESIVPHQ